MPDRALRQEEIDISMKKDLTQGKVISTMLLFAGPMILGNLLQQCYNIADTLIVGHFLGPDALAAVGSAYTLMTFLTSVLIGLCMGSGSVFSLYFGRKEEERMKSSMYTAFLFIGAAAVVMNVLVLWLQRPILRLLQTPDELFAMMEEYVGMIFLGIFFVFLYNYFAFLLRALGNSVTPLWFLGAAAVLNIVLDLLFVAVWGRGIKGAAEATVIAQIFSGLGIGVYTWVREPSLRPEATKENGTIRQTGAVQGTGSVQEPGSGRRRKQQGVLREILRFSMASCIQQSVMNFGILMIQGLVNSFGTQVMAAFAAAVKIDSFAYMPAQEFGNAFSLFTSQNHGAGKKARVKEGIRSAVTVSLSFCLLVSLLVWLTAPWLMRIFIDASETEIIRIGTGYLRVEGAFYCGIGLLFLLYGYFRGVEQPEMSIVLTVISLGTRVLLAYVLSPIPKVGVWGIWWAIPIGWFLADITGIWKIWGQSRKTAA